mmetsp:Transcript_18734/g.25347  ORF Transcript_18734/g.25347 Transcript_18734/m.25347 type:complete len:163 (+) Transcript_18734:493-981(+)
MNPASSEFIPNQSIKGNNLRSGTDATHDESGRGRGRGRGGNRGDQGDPNRGRGSRGGRGRDGLPHGINPQNENEREQVQGHSGRGGRGGRRGGGNQPQAEGEGQRRRNNRGEFFDQKRREKNANDRDTNRLLEDKDHQQILSQEALAHQSAQHMGSRKNNTR